MRMNELLMDAMHLVEMGVVTKEQVDCMEVSQLKDLVDNHQV